MSTNWWDELFLSHYKFLQNFSLFFLGLSLPVRMISAYLSLKPSFMSEDLVFFLSVVFLIVLLLAFSDLSLHFKKVFFFLFLQLSALQMRYLSTKIAPDAENIFCVQATIFLLLFELSVYNNQFTLVFLFTKHALLWGFFDPVKMKMKDYNGKEYYIIMGSFISLMFVYHSERIKKSLLRENHESKKKHQEAHDHLLTILKLFPDGLLVFDSNFTLKFSNNSTIDYLLPSEGLVNFLQKTINNHNDLSLKSLINDFTSSNTEIEKSFGLFQINSKQFKIHGHKIIWQRTNCCMLAIRDISDVIALERLQIENKSKTMMINSISHELRTPLNCISLVVDEVIPKVSNELAEKLKSCKSCIKLLTFQLNDMMDYSEILAGSFFPHFSQVNVRKMLRNSLELIKIPAEYKKLAVSCKISDNVPDRIEIDGYRVQKVVINLLTNALKYTLKGKLQLSAKVRRGSLKIKVKDTGIGIPEKRLSEICELFTDSANSALSGLGLHICKEILKTFDSKLKVKSSEGRGSSFSFCVDLKRTDLKGLDDVQKEFSKGFSMKSGEFPQFEDFPCILVVDDTDFSRMCVVNLLKNEGVSVFEACNGQEAVDFVVNYDKVGIQLKCIIMDINMPVMDGWKAARLLKKLFLQGSLSYFPSIIGYTAFSQQGDINKCYESGMISYLNKPTSKQELVSSIKKYI